MRSIKVSKYLKFSIVSLIVIIITTIALYIANFWNYQISDISSDWGTFGDYLGGVLNPIIALVGTSLLAYISMQLSKDDSEEKLKYFKKEQAERHSYFKKEEAQRHQYFLSEHKIKAYDMLTKKVEKLKNIEAKMYTLDSLTKGSGNVERAKDELGDTLYELVISLKEMYNEILIFPLKHDHLFEYDFHSKEFQDLIEGINSSNEKLNEMLGYDKEKHDEKFFENLAAKLIVRTDIFLSKIQEELIYKNNKYSKK